MRGITCFLLFCTIANACPAGAAAAARGAEPVAAVTSGTFTLLAPAERDAFLREMKTKLEKLKSMRSEFAQERRMALFVDTLKAQGVFYYQAPDRLRWEVRRPYHSILLYSQKRAAKFDVADGKARPLSLGGRDAMQEVLRQILAWMRGDFEKTRELYELQVFRGKEVRLVLVPRSKELRQITQSIELAVDRETSRIQRVTIREQKGDRIRLTFSKEQDNVELNAMLFDLKHPVVTPLEKAP